MVIAFLKAAVVLVLIAFGVLTLCVMLRDRKRQYAFDGSYEPMDPNSIQLLIHNAVVIRARYNDLQAENLEDVGSISQHRENLDMLENELQLTCEKFILLHNWTVDSVEGVILSQVIYNGVDYQKAMQRVFELGLKKNAPVECA